MSSVTEPDPLHASDPSTVGEAAGDRRAMLKHLAWMVVLAAGFTAWLISVAREQTPFEVLSHALQQRGDGWYITGTAINHGPAAAHGYLEVQYYEPGQKKNSHRRFVLKDLPSATPFPFEQGPLLHVDPQRAHRYTVYIGTEPSLYGDM